MRLLNIEGKIQSSKCTMLSTIVGIVLRRRTLGCAVSAGDPVAPTMRLPKRKYWLNRSAMEMLRSVKGCHEQ